MKPTLIITIITAVVAVAAGVAIAGLPSTPPGAEVRVLEVSTGETLPTTTRAATTTAPAETSVASTSTTSTTARVDPVPTITTPPSTPPETTEAPADELRQRDVLVVASANATDVSGVAAAHAEELRGLGYSETTPVDAEVTPTSAVYYLPGFELEAVRMAIELEWGVLAVVPMDEIPTLLTDRTFELVALVGLDQS